MIKEVIVKEIKKNIDSRGYLAELFRNDEIEFSPEMGYLSFTNPGVVRGPHEHVWQSDCFVFVGPGSFQLHLWDNRPGSETFKEYAVIEVGENNPLLVIVPPGVVHGYKCTSDVPGMSLNFPDKLYRGVGKKEEVDEIRHEEKEDSIFKI